MTTLWKWAWCKCPMCNQVHRDLIHCTMPTVDKRGRPRKINQVCDRCYTARMTTAAAFAYRAHKERLVQNTPCSS